LDKFLPHISGSFVENDLLGRYIKLPLGTEMIACPIIKYFKVTASKNFLQT
jgi:hypothetical protein